MPTELADQVATNLASIRTRVAESAERAGRAPTEVSLIAVSKAQPDARIEAALAAGCRCFGENRVQEAQQHWSKRRTEHADLELHLIGPLQRNKVKTAVELFDVIHTVDRPKLATALTDAFASTGRALRCFVEVNVGEEPQKAGVLPGQLEHEA